jgi:3-phosphoshikimate 1-carboxyvinyltransferase
MHVKVKPAARLDGEIQALSSKNYTTRCMLAAALAEGESELLYPARSDDSDALRRCLRALGAELEETEERLVIRGFGARPKAAKELDVGNAGAVLRFLMSVAALCPGDVSFPNKYPESLGKRPHLDLIHALEQMNVRVTHRDGRLPITIHGGAPRGGRIRQFPIFELPAVHDAAIGRRQRNRSGERPEVEGRRQPDAGGAGAGRHPGGRLRRPDALPRAGPATL